MLAMTESGRPNLIGEIWRIRGSSKFANSAQVIAQAAERLAALPTNDLALEFSEGKMHHSISRDGRWGHVVDSIIRMV